MFRMTVSTTNILARLRRNLAEEERRMAGTAEKMRSYTGAALFSYGFRPFFLLAALWAIGAMLM